LFAQPVLVETSLPQFAADIPANRSLAGLAVSAAVSFALLAQTVLVFAGAPQFLALPALATPVVDADASRSDLDGLRKRWDRSHNNGGCCRDGECELARSLKHRYSSQLKPVNPGCCRMHARSDSFLSICANRRRGPRPSGIRTAVCGVFRQSGLAFFPVATARRVVEG
jgi:hypothetical protein